MGLSARFRATQRITGTGMAHNVRLPVCRQRTNAITAKEIAISHAAARIIWAFCGDLSIAGMVSDFAASGQ